MTISEAVSHVVLKLRYERRWSQRDMAKKSGFQRTYISKIERGLAVPTIDTFARFAEALEVSASELLSLCEKFVAELSKKDATEVGGLALIPKRFSSVEDVRLPASVSDPEAVERRKKLAQAIGTISQEKRA